MRTFLLTLGAVVLLTALATAQLATTQPSAPAATTTSTPTAD